MNLTPDIADEIADRLAAGLVENIRAASFGPLAANGAEWVDRMRALVDVFAAQVVHLADDARPPRPERDPDLGETWRDVATLMYARLTAGGFDPIEFSGRDLLNSASLQIEAVRQQDPATIIVRRSL